MKFDAFVLMTSSDLRHCIWKSHLWHFSTHMEKYQVFVPMY